MRGHPRSHLLLLALACALIAADGANASPIYDVLQIYDTSSGSLLSEGFRSSAQETVVLSVPAASAYAQVLLFDPVKNLTTELWVTTWPGRPPTLAAGLQPWSGFECLNDPQSCVFVTGERQDLSSDVLGSGPLQFIYQRVPEPSGLLLFGTGVFFAFAAVFRADRQFNGRVRLTSMFGLLIGLPTAPAQRRADLGLLYFLYLADDAP